jgi:hypothetical protein
MPCHGASAGCIQDNTPTDNMPGVEKPGPGPARQLASCLIVGRSGTPRCDAVMIGFAAVRRRSVSRLSCRFERPRTPAYEQERRQLHNVVAAGDRVMNLDRFDLR